MTMMMNKSILTQTLEILWDFAVFIFKLAIVTIPLAMLMVDKHH